MRRNGEGFGRRQIKIKIKGMMLIKGGMMKELGFFFFSIRSIACILS